MICPPARWGPYREFALSGFAWLRHPSMEQVVPAEVGLPIATDDQLSLRLTRSGP